MEEPHVIDLDVRTAEIQRINQNEIRNITGIYTHSVLKTLANI